MNVDFEKWWAKEPFGFDHPDTKKGIESLLNSRNDRITEILITLELADNKNLLLENKLAEKEAILAEKVDGQTYHALTNVWRQKCGEGLVERQELREKLNVAVTALRFYDDTCDHRTYLDIFDCIKKESESITSFDQVKFGATAREALKKIGEGV
jgi:hypothetical protein